MIRSIASGLFAILGVLVVGVLPVACESGGVGDPCIPEDEYNPLFSGYKVTEENIESRSFQCKTRICLVNHFQGRVSCPLGQGPIDGATRKDCNGLDDPSCGADSECVVSATLAEPCTKDDECNGFGGRCNKAGKFCECGTDADCGLSGDMFCDAKDKHCKSYVCHKKGACQVPGETAENNQGKDCCVPGTDTPVSPSVCGQCSDTSNRNAADSVYCSCRCGPPDGAKPEDNENFNFCECPSGYVCSEIRKDVGISDPLIAGKYCIKEGTEFVDDKKCGTVNGYVGASCSGVAGAL